MRQFPIGHAHEPQTAPDSAVLQGFVIDDIDQSRNFNKAQSERDRSDNQEEPAKSPDSAAGTSFPLPVPF